MDIREHHHSTTNPNPNSSPGGPEGERLLGIAKKLLENRDLTGSREFALLSQETDPLLEESDQILAITDVLIASEKRVVNNRHHDWYAILQTNRHSLSSDPDLLRKNYRRLAILLHPDKNHFPHAESAFKFVSDAWALLSDPSRRGPYDQELNVNEKVDLHHHPTPPHVEKEKLPVRRSPRCVGLDPYPYPTPVSVHGGSGTNKFWTACPYCYVLYEYPKMYEDCCLRCQNCERAFHGCVINSLPPTVPEKEAYYCCWGFFPLGFSLEGKKIGSDNNGNNSSNWMPGGLNLNKSDPGVGNNSAPVRVGAPGTKKRGRPRKNP